MILNFSCGCTETVTLHKDGMEVVTVFHMCKECVSKRSGKIQVTYPLMEGLEEGLVLEVRASVVKR